VIDDKRGVRDTLRATRACTARPGAGVETALRTLPALSKQGEIRPAPAANWTTIEEFRSKARLYKNAYDLPPREEDTLAAAGAHAATNAFRQGCWTDIFRP